MRPTLGFAAMIPRALMFAALAWSAAHALTGRAAVGDITTLIGNGVGDGGAPLGAILRTPGAVTLDTRGNLYVAESFGHRIRKLGVDGSVSTLAGTGQPGFSGDGGPATSAEVNQPASVAIDALGHVYFADYANHRVRRIDSAGVITTVAGTGIAGFDGDGGPAVAARLNGPRGIAFDTAGRLLIAESGSKRVRRIEAGVIGTVAGNGNPTFAGEGGPATAAQLDPWGIASDGAGGFYVGDILNARLYRVDAAGTFRTVHAGSSVAGVCRNDDGQLYFAHGFVDHKITAIDTTGTSRRIAGTGAFGFAGDGGPALDAILGSPMDVACGGSTIYIADSANGRLRRVMGGLIDTVMGGGTGDGFDAANAALAAPSAVASDAAGNVFVADLQARKIRRMGADGRITTTLGFPSENIAPMAIASDATGALYVADLSGHRVLRWSGAGSTLFAGTSPGPGFTGDGGPALQARFSSPSGVAVDAANNVYIADGGNHRIRKVDADGIVRTVAGNGSSAFAGDGGPALLAGMSVHGIALDNAGNIYFADPLNHRVRRVTADGRIETVAGNGTAGDAGDGADALAAQLDHPRGLAFELATGRLFISDRESHRVRVVEPGGTIATVAGTGTAGFSGDGGRAAAAMLAFPDGLHVDGEGGLLVADLGNGRVRKIDLGDRVPRPFSFAEVFDVAVATTVQSAPVVPTGFTIATSISISGGEYSIGCSGSFVSTAGTLQPGQSVCVRHTSAARVGTRTLTHLVVGGVVGGFSSVTVPGRPTSTSLSSQPRASIAGQTVVLIATVNAESGTPGGTVAFMDGAVSLCRSALVEGVARCSTSSLGAGTRALVASYEADAIYAASTSTAHTHRVLAAGTPLSLTIALAGAGAGRVQSVPDLVDCGSRCTASPAEVVDVTLRATPEAGSVFGGWSTPACAGLSECAVMIDGAIRVEATFVPTGPRLLMAPEAVDFGSYPVGSRSAPTAFTVVNASNATVAVGPVTVTDPQFELTHDCVSLPPAGRCVVRVSFVPAASSGNGARVTAQLRVGAEGVEAAVARLEATSKLQLVDHFYRTILRREAEAAGRSYWESEADRVKAAGADINEVWFAMAMAFFDSAEYAGQSRDDDGYLVDLYRAFFNREPDAEGVVYWRDQIRGGMPREVVLTSFMFSPEFLSFTRGLFGDTAARAEVDMVMDLYRGLLSRLPDSAGLAHWVRLLRLAQCQGAVEVHQTVEIISHAFLESTEFSQRGRTFEQVVADFYNAVLRRGGDLPGVRYWIEQLSTGALSPRQVRRVFINSPEFQQRVSRVIAQGCIP